MNEKIYCADDICFHVPTPKIYCFKCEKDCANGLYFTRISDDQLPFMPLESSSHMECYIEEVVEVKLK